MRVDNKAKSPVTESPNLFGSLNLSAVGRSNVSQTMACMLRYLGFSAFRALGFLFSTTKPPLVVFVVTLFRKFRDCEQILEMNDEILSRPSMNKIHKMAAEAPQLDHHTPVDTTTQFFSSVDRPNADIPSIEIEHYEPFNSNFKRPGPSRQACPVARHDTHCNRPVTPPILRPPSNKPSANCSLATTGSKHHQDRLQEISHFQTLRIHDQKPRRA